MKARYPSSRKRVLRIYRSIIKFKRTNVKIKLRIFVLLSREPLSFRARAVIARGGKASTLPVSGFSLKTRIAPPSAMVANGDQRSLLERKPEYRAKAPSLFSLWRARKRERFGASGAAPRLSAIKLKMVLAFLFPVRDPLFQN